MELGNLWTPKIVRKFLDILIAPIDHSFKSQKRLVVLFLDKPIFIFSWQILQNKILMNN